MQTNFKVMIDYTRNVFYSRELKKQQLEQENKDTTQLHGVRNKQSNDMFMCFNEGINRLMNFQRFQRQKEGKIQELIRQLRRQNSGVIKNEARKTEKVIEEQTPIMK